MEKELGFDRAYNYKTVNIRAALKEGAPKKVDCYFDNVCRLLICLLEVVCDYIILIWYISNTLYFTQVGGEISSTILSYMNKYGRVAVCGSISSYNDTQLPKGR